MPAEPVARVPEAIARALCEFAMLPIAPDRLGVLAEVLNDILSGRDALSALDLSEVEPGAAFDARWE